jgi:membrane-bound lytic murein transglycosylase D
MVQPLFLSTAVRPVLFIGLLLIMLSGSGCALNENLTWIDVDFLSAEEAAAVDQDPELQPVIAESEICLDQELEALASTGSWDTPQTEHPTKVVDAQLAPAITYDFPIIINRQVEMYLELFQGKLRPYFSQWLARSGRYQPMMKAELEAAGLPLDLVYLSMIESGFSQRAYSRAKAVGLWQFMAGTGRDYGLNVTRYLDERRDAEKSTRAAVSYLKHLYNEFGDWYLAVAAYNGGPGTMRNALKRSGSSDFWEIAEGQYIHLETKRYVPKLIAAIIIAKDPATYGFTDIVYEAPLAYETLTVGPGLSLQAAALLTDSEDTALKQLNQELLAGKTPLDCEQYELKIPPGTRELAERNLPRLHRVASTDYQTHIIQKNETLAQICKKYNINTTTLLKVNNLKSNRLVIGSRLRIPYRTIAYRLLPEGMDPRLAAGDDLQLHTVKKGDTISKISRQYQVPADLIVSWNGLTNAHQISIGQQLALYIGGNESNSAAPAARDADTAAQASLPGVVVLTAVKKLPPEQKQVQAAAVEQKQVQAVVAKQKQAQTVAAKQKPVQLVAANQKQAQSAVAEQWYQVRNGDSLWTISRRFNTSPADIKKWNNLKSNLIHPGSRLKLIDV